MGLYLEVVQGPNSVGTRFKLRKNDRLGRSSCEIAVADSKISTFHAQVTSDANGKLILLDRNSRNGLFINDQRVKKVTLLPGVTFRAGRTYFKVVELFVDDVGEDIIHEVVQKIPPSWRDHLLQSLTELNGQNKPSNTPIIPFQPAVKLVFKEGPMTDKEIILGYSPREIGLETLDVLINERFSPSVAFQVHQDSYGIKYTTSLPSAVVLNEQFEASTYLKDGDVIRIGDTLIEVQLIYG